MTYAQVYEFFKNKRDTECKYTSELIANGFHQKENSEGYLRIAKECGFNSIPSQWWHLMNYCLKYYEKKKEHNTFSENVTCGELIFWMAEVSGAVSKEQLESLKKEIIENYLKKRPQGNIMIKNVCWEEIKKVVEAQK